MKAKTISYPISLPSLGLQEKINRLIKNIAHLVSTFKLRKLYSTPLNAQSRPSRLRVFPNIPLKRIVRLFLVLMLVGLVVFVGGRIISGVKNGPDRRERVEGAKAVQDINREFSFPLRNRDGEEVSRIKYLLERAELRNEIVVKGQRATAIKGREFLILTLKIRNEYNQSIEIDTRDYVRLSVNKNEEEWLAPDIHNDPVEVQAISTKYTRVGFPINDTDRNLVLGVGEINAVKEKISLSLK